MRRVGETLAAEQTSPRRHRLWRGAAAAGLAAAVAVAALVWRGRGSGSPGGAPGIVQTTQPRSRPADDGGNRPRAFTATVGAYRSAYAGAPETLDDLLSQGQSFSRSRPLRAGALRLFQAQPDDAYDHDPPPGSH